MRYQRSSALFKSAQRVIPGGVNSPVRAFKAVGGTPVFVEKAKGAYLYDVDGNTLIDYISSWGPMILGHAFEPVIEAVKLRAESGTSYGMPTELETQIAELAVQMVPNVDKIRMVNSGTEACMSAVRLARGYTQREKIIKFAGCYHGHSDAFLIQAGSGAVTFGAPNSPGVTQGTAVALGGTTTTDSLGIIGQISLSSHKAFTVTPGVATNHFTAAATAETSTLSTMGAVDISSQNGATNALSVIDGALAMISEVRSEMGAAENRLTSTVDNLSNVSVNTQRSLTSVEDANFASETSALTKAQILQQAATSMLAQANKAKQTMLVLLQG